MHARYNVWRINRFPRYLLILVGISPNGYSRVTGIFAHFEFQSTRLDRKIVVEFVRGEKHPGTVGLGDREETCDCRRGKPFGGIGIFGSGGDRNHRRVKQF